jgi:AAA15 family ATPase/GTPase
MLNSLEIKNFRMLEDFKVAKLGRVNLIVGKNNSGKSTVLEALRIYAGNGHHSLMEKIAISHDEKFWLDDELDSSLPFEDLFVGRQFPKDDDTQIIIGESEASKESLTIKHVLLMGIVIDATKETPLNIIPKSEVKALDSPTTEALLVSKNGRRFVFKLGRTDYLIPKDFTTVPCGFIPTQFISMDELALEWDKIVLTQYDEVVRQALKIIAPTFENLVFVQGNKKRFAKVKVSDSIRPVPLKSLGDGMIRVLQLALKLVSAKGGFLLIDEFENGLHYSTHEKIWALLFEMAEKLDIQVFATTHSWDCIESFTKVALDNEKTEGLLFRMGRSAQTSNRGQIIATVFDKERLYSMTQADIEIR